MLEFKDGKFLVPMSQEELSNYFEYLKAGNRTEGTLPIQTPVATSVDETDLTMEVTNILKRIGIPAHIRGFNFLREAIILSVSDENYINEITKSLYPTIAKKFDTTPSRAERAIRHAIEVAFSSRGNIGELSMYFGYTVDPVKGKATNSEFIATIADTLRLRRKE